MNVLDEDGDLFGVLNVIDALVGLLVIAVAVAGASLLLESPLAIIATVLAIIVGMVAVINVIPDPDTSTNGPQTMTLPATLDLGAQPRAIIQELSVGDTDSPTTSSTIEITDIHVAPNESETEAARVLLGVTLQGPPATSETDTIAYGGHPPRVGRNLTIETASYEVTGTLRDIGDGPDLTSTDAVLETTVPAETAATIQPGDTYTIGAQPVATVKSLTRYTTDTPANERVLVGLTLETRHVDTTPYFGTTPVQQGANLHLQTATYTLTGTLTHVGTTTPTGDVTTRSVTLELEAPPHLANAVREGMTDTTAADTVAEITTITETPTTVGQESEDGNLQDRPHPRHKSVTLTADLTLRDTPHGLTFKHRYIQAGTTITLNLGPITIHPTIIAL